MRIFLDTNVWISAFVARGICADLVRVLLTRHELGLDRLIVSQPLRSEFVRIMKGKFKASSADLVEPLEILDSLESAADIEVRISRNIPDDDDIPIIRSALAGKSNVFITGDKPLLELGTVSGMSVMSPRQAIKAMTSER